MSKNTILKLWLIFIVLLVISGCKQDSPRSGENRMSSQDEDRPSGPTVMVEMIDPPEQEPPEWMEGKRGMDVQSVIIETDGSQLRATVIIDEDYKTYLDEYKWGVAAVEIYFDTDNNEETGGETFCGSRPGFEYKLKPLSGVEVKILTSEGEVTMKLFEGGSSNPSAEITNYLSSYSLSRYKPGQWPDEETVINSITDEAQQSSHLEGNSLIVEVPYELIGVQSGQIIRIAVQENHAKEKYCDDKYLEDAILLVQ